ncbi:MAG: hypothetical protein ACD_79C00148G0002 [uncultured bacterium]|nr:MAG: hypothetical protein ACD_79C00148G0002 [uncultured bacterium]
MKNKSKHFEDFVSGKHSKDIFSKICELDNALKSDMDLQASVEALGIQMLGPSANHTNIKETDGKIHEIIQLGSNSYLSLTTHPGVIAASKSACDKYGYGMGAVSLYSGTSDLHRKLEKMIAALYQTQDAILFPCGYSTNVGIISALCGPGDVILNDALNHASIFDGCRLSGADVKVYLHNNVRHLEKLLKNIPSSAQGRLIVTDGVFSMNGDLASLDAIIDLATKYGARVMVDDAHGLGIVGPKGRGTAEYFGVMDKVDLHVGMLSKTPGAIGGYCAGNSALIQYLRYYARTYFFSTSLPAPVVAGLIEVFNLLLNDQAGRELLWKNVNALRNGLNKLGFNTGKTQSAIIPVIIGDEPKLIRFCNELRNNGIYTNIVSYPAVRRKECRLRICVMNSLTEEDIARVLYLFQKIGQEHGII